MKYSSRIILFLFLLPISLYSGKLTLKESEELAINNSFDLKDLQRSASIAMLSYKIGVRDFLPQLSFNYNDSRQVKIGNSDTESIQMGLTVDQPVYNGGRSLLQRKLSGIQLNLSHSSFSLKVDEIRDQVWQLYHQVMIFQRKLELQNELLKLSRDQVIITRKKFDLGSITQIELLEAEIEVQTLEVELSGTKNSYFQLKSKFNKLLGLDLTAEMELYPEIEISYPGLNILTSQEDYYYKLAVSGSKELESVRFEIQQAKAQYDISKKSFIPSIGLQGSLSYAGDSFPLQNPTFSLKVNVSFPSKAMPITSNTSISSDIKTLSSRSQGITVAPLQDMSFLVDTKSAMINLNRTLEKEKNTIQQLYFSINQLVSDLEQKRETLKLKRKAFDLQGQKLRILETRYKLGEVKELDLLKGNIEYYNMEISIWESILELVLTERTLEKSVGLGLGELSNLEVGS